jgi:hypothetical protein
MLYYSLPSLLMEIKKKKKIEGMFCVIRFCMVCLAGEKVEPNGEGKFGTFN